MSIKPVILKYRTTDIGLNKVLEAYKDKINTMIEQIPWLTASVEYIRLDDTNETHYLEVFWGEDALANRTLEIDVNAANRVINLAGNLSITGSLTTSAANQVGNWTVTGDLVAATATINNEGLHLLDTGGDHDLIIKPGSNLGADRILTITTGDAARTITLSGNPTLDDWFDQGVKAADAPGFATGVTIGNLTLADGSITDSSNAINFGNEALSTTGTLGAGAITGTSFIIGGNTLDTNEWTFLDGLDQALKTSDAPGFATGVTIGNLTFADGSITDSGGSITFVNENLDTSGYIALKSNAELRFYDNGNYVGFEAPALGADQIWILPTADGALGEHMVTDGAGTLSFTTGAGTGDVSAAANMTDHTIIRGNGGAKGVQDTGITIDDNDAMTIAASVGTQLTLSRVAGSPSIVGSANNHLILDSGGTGLVYLNNYNSTDIVLAMGGGKVFIADTVNTKMTVGLTMNQGASDNEILALKSSDIAHGMTDVAETDTYATFMKSGATVGGLYLRGFSETTTGMYITGVASTANTTKSTAGLAPIILRSCLKTAATYGNVSANGNLVAIVNQATTRWICDEDGDTWQSGRVTATAGATVSAANMYKALGVAEFERSSSSNRYKDKIKDLEIDSSLIYNLQPRSFNSLCGSDDKNRRWVGLIAEEVESVLPEIVVYDANNKADSYDNQMIMTLMLAEVQKLRQELNELKIKDKEK